jgi:hypothetical protein
MTKTQTLLEKALAIPNAQKQKFSDEEIELTLAWLTGKVSLTQAAGALEMKPSGLTHRMALIMREAYRLGKIKVA